MSDKTKIIGWLVVIIIFLCSISVTIFNVFPPKIANFPQSDLSDNNRLVAI